MSALQHGDFDTAAECRYTVPSATSIGMLYQGLVLSTMKDEDTEQSVQHLPGAIVRRSIAGCQRTMTCKAKVPVSQTKS